MNRKERVKLAFAHQEADRVPMMALTIDNPTAAHVLDRPNLCGFGGRIRGVAQNRALMEGTYIEYHRQKLADEIELYRTLELDSWGEAQPIPRSPLVPEQVEEKMLGVLPISATATACRLSNIPMVTSIRS